MPVIGADACFLCGSANVVPCDGDCGGAVAACSARHLQVHRPPGIGRCLPFRVSENADVGRFMVATRDIEPGEIVLLDRAVVVAPEDKPVCLGCHSRLSLSSMAPCPRCQFPLCGSASCRRPDSESSHHSEEECAALAASGVRPKISDLDSPHFLYQAIGILRLVFAARRSEGAREDIGRLASHVEIRSRDPSVKTGIARLSSFIRDELGVAGLTDSEVLEAFGVLKTNCVGVPEVAARAVYPVAALINHSCVPNLDPMVQAAGNFGFKAQRRIGSGEELTIRYTPTIKHRLRLRQELRRGWLFDCRCQRCEDPTELGSFLSSPRCSDCGEGFHVARSGGMDSDAWPCCKCGLEISTESVLERDQEANALSMDGDGGKMSFKKMCAMLQVLNRKFHPNYYLSTKLKFKIAMVALEELQGEDEVGEKMRLCGELQGVLSLVDPGRGTRMWRAVAGERMAAQLALLKLRRAGGKMGKEEYVRAVTGCLNEHRARTKA